MASLVRFQCKKLLGLSKVLGLNLERKGLISNNFFIIRRNKRH